MQRLFAIFVAMSLLAQALLGCCCHYLHGFPGSASVPVAEASACCGHGCNQEPVSRPVDDPPRDSGCCVKQLSLSAPERVDSPEAGDCVLFERAHSESVVMTFRGAQVGPSVALPALALRLHLLHQLLLI